MTNNPNELTIENSVLVLIDHQPWIALMDAGRWWKISEFSAASPTPARDCEPAFTFLGDS